MNNFFGCRQILLFILCIITFSSFSQQEASRHKWFHAGYCGENITHYGFKAGYGYSFLNAYKVKKRSKKSVLNQAYAEANVFSFVHPDNQLVAGLMPEIGYRHTGQGSWFFQVNMGAGVLRTIYLANTYSADGSGNFKKIDLGGKWAPGTSIGIGGGRSLNKKTKNNLLLLGQIKLMEEFNYNQKILFRPVFHVAVLKLL